MADKIKKGDWSANTTGILLMVGPILVILFNSLNPVNAANAFSFSFSPDKIEGVISALSGNESNSQLYGILLTLSLLLLPLSIGGIARICQDDPGRKWASFGFVLSIVAVAIWAVSNGISLALATAVSDWGDAMAATAMATQAGNAAGAAQAQQAAGALAISAGVMNAVVLGSHQMATTIFMVGTLSVGVGMTMSGAFNSIISRLIALGGLVGLVLVLLYPVSSDPGFAIVGIIFLVLAIKFVVAGVTIIRASRK